MLEGRYRDLEGFDHNFIAQAIVKKTKMNPVSIPSKIVLHYFGIPARAEAIRVALRFANIPFEDRIETDWRTTKPTFQPWEHLPMLEADGFQIYHSVNILQYVGRFANLIPATAAEEFRANEVIYGCEDFGSAFATTSSITDPEKKLEARRALCEPGGGLQKILVKLEKIIGTKQYVAGNQFSIADAALFAAVGNLSCGLYDGIPTNILDGYPNLRAFHRHIGSIPQIAQGYENVSKPWVIGFKIK